MAIERSHSSLRLHSVRRLSNEQLGAELDRLNTQKRAVDAELLLYLSELERRGLYREQAYSSLFEFCVIRLGQSEDVAYKRVGAARLMLKYPKIYDLLAEGRIHLTGLMLLKPHLTSVNHLDWLLAVSGKSKRQIEKLIATRIPQPDVPSSLRKLPVRQSQHAVTTASPSESQAAEAKSEATTPPSLGNASAPALHVMPTETATALQSGAAQSHAAQSSAAQSSAPNLVAPARIAPLSSHTYRVVFTASERLKQKLDRAGELLSHVIAHNDLPAILERALDQLIAREERRRYGVHSTRTDSKRSVGAEAAPEQVNEQPDEPREPAPPLDELDQFMLPERESPLRQTPSIEDHDGLRERELNAPCQNRSPSATELQDPDPNLGVRAEPRSRYVPAAVRREVWARDGGQCTFTDRTGRRCEQRRFLELDHREAFAIGGSETVENLRLRCHAHNALEAESLFGHRRMESAIAHAQRVRAAHDD